MLNIRVLLCILKPFVTGEPQVNPLWRSSPSFTAWMGPGAASSSPSQTHILRAALQTSSTLPGAAWTISGREKKPTDTECSGLSKPSESLAEGADGAGMWNEAKETRGAAFSKVLITKRFCQMWVHLFQVFPNLNSLGESRFIAVSPDLSCKQSK